MYQIRVDFYSKLFLRSMSKVCAIYRQTEGISKYLLIMKILLFFEVFLLSIKMCNHFSKIIKFMTPTGMFLFL